MSELVTGTRVFGKFEPERYLSQLTPFVENAAQFGRVIIVSQQSYENLVDLRQFAQQSSKPGEKIQVVLSDTIGAESPADMCNRIVLACAALGFDYFAIVSGDLAEYIPERFPIMIDRLQSNHDISSIGVAIQGVHNLGLLDRVKQHGIAEVTLDNYATIFHNNAFAIHRLHPRAGETIVDVSDRLFPRVTDQGKLGSVTLDGQEVPIGGNEEIALALQLLKQNIELDTLLLAGSHTIIRDPDKELSTIDAKILRRPAVAKAYQQHYNITDGEISAYLQSHYRISFS